MAFFMKRLRKSNRQDQLMRALIVIEMLSLLNEIVSEEEKADVLGSIYSIAHGVLGHCKACGNKWTRLVENLEADFLAKNHCNPKRVLAKSSKKTIPLYLRG